MEREFIKFRKYVLRWMDRINSKPSYPWLSTSLAAFLAVQGLRGLWPMSSIGSTAATSDVTDISGQSRHLTNTSAILDVSGLISRMYFDGANDYLTRADEAGLDITGTAATEPYIAAAQRGLTLGGWYNFNALSPASNKGIIGKFRSAPANDRSYLIFIPSGTATPRFVVSVDGTAEVGVTSTFTMSISTWYFIVSRFKPSTELSITVNGTQSEDTNLVGVPASIFNSASDFNIMAYYNGLASTRNSGYAGINFLACSYLEDTVINHLFEMSRGMYGV